MDRVVGEMSSWSGIRFGAAYYAEYHRGASRVDADLDLMAAAGFTVIRVGESVWSTWEPREGEFDLDWLLPVLDGAAARGIEVILGTPTYAVPPWLQVAHPEIAAQPRTGVPIPWGSRQEIDYTHPTFRRYAERIIRAVVGRYADHPAVVGFQVDNEPGMVLFHNPETFDRFVEWLQQRYGDVATLNDEWGLTYWSHRIGDWSELWRPDGNSFPQYDLAWRRFQAEQTTEFLSWQADLVREYGRPDQFVMTCLQYPRPGIDERALNLDLDVTAGNPYYGMQDRLGFSGTRAPLNDWTTSGAPGLFRQADRMFASKQARYLVTETDAQSIGGSSFNQPPYEGQLAQAAMALISRGAAMIEYWHWHTIPYGAETYWGGVLPHSLVPGRIYREISALGADLRSIGAELDGYEPDADVLMLWSVDSRFALQFQPPFMTPDGHSDPESFEHLFDAFHAGVISSGGQARIMHVEQAREAGAEDLARRFPVLIAAGVYVLDGADLALLRDYARAGGHLILGPRTGYADMEARARVAMAPDVIGPAAGVHYEEFSNLEDEVSVRGAAGLELSPIASATLWSEGLIADGADILAHYDHPWFSRFPAVTSTAHGDGRITIVGTVPNAEFAASLARWAVPRPVGAFASSTSRDVQVASGTLPDGRRVWFTFNWSWDSAEFTLHDDVTELLTGTPRDAGTTISLGPWSTQIHVAGSI